MKTLGTVLLALAILAGGSGVRVYADTSVSTEDRLKLLEQEVAILKRQIEVDKEEAAKKAPNLPIVTASAKDGFSIKAPDDSYKLKLSGYVQADARIFPDNKKDTGTTDTFTTRTVRLVASGTVANNFDYYIAPEFAGSTVNLPDAYLDWRLDPAFKIRTGKFKAPFGYERLQSTPASTFAEPALVENLAPNRDSGIQLYGDLLANTVSYAVALTNGVTDGGTSITDTNNDKEIGARLFAQPFRNSNVLALRGLGVGGAVSYGHREDTTLPTYKTAGQTTFFTLAGTTFDGPQLRYAPQVAYYYNSLGLYGEYIASQAKLTKTAKRQDIRNDGWVAAASYVVTGEDASYKGIVPLHPFSLKDGGWGAVELTGRYSTLDLDNKLFDSTLTSNVITSSPTEARAWTAGVNWYLTGNTKLVFNWEQTNYKGGAVGGNRLTENLLLTRFQLSF
ncbi:MAG: porin [Candidatus Omnitrophota bacterium]